MVKRLLNPLKSKSLFIFGARGTGKSTFIKNQFTAKNVFSINLLKPEIENKYSLNPERLEQEILALEKKPDWIFIDEIQKVSKLLDVVHSLIEDHQFKFILTGSSARKIKRGAANLLAGRAFVYNLFPFSYLELGSDFSLENALHWGLMPTIWSLNSDREKKTYLQSYALTYLNEEIKAEQLVRKIDPFRSYLEILGQVSGKIINHKKIANEVGVDIKTVQTYFQIIEETLLGFYLPAFHDSVRKSQRLNPKFYLLDTGLKKTLEGSLEQKPVSRTSVYGDLFEHFILNEIYKLNHYFEKDFKLSFFATKNDVEIDLVLSKNKKHFLIEIKSSNKIDQSEIASFAKSTEAFTKVEKCFYLSQDKNEYKIGNIHCIYWENFLKKFEKL